MLTNWLFEVGILYNIRFHIDRGHFQLQLVCMYMCAILYTTTIGFHMVVVKNFSGTANIFC